jgi:hypothetical protein
VIEPQVQRVQERVPILVQRNQELDQIIRKAQQILCLHRPNFVSPLSEYVTVEELPRGWKILKFTKFGGETNESTIKHIYLSLLDRGR